MTLRPLHWNVREVRHGDVSGTSSHFRHHGYGEIRVIVADGAVVDAERFAEIVGQYDTQELTPVERLGAIFRFIPAKSTKATIKPPIEEIVVEELLDATESYTRIEEIVRKESRSTDDYELEADRYTRTEVLKAA
jgi:hypothetical protein